MRTGIGSTGTVPTLSPTMKRDQIRHPLAEGNTSGFGGFWKLHPLNCGDAS